MFAARISKTEAWIVVGALAVTFAQVVYRTAGRTIARMVSARHAAVNMIARAIVTLSRRVETGGAICPQ